MIKKYLLPPLFFLIVLVLISGFTQAEQEVSGQLEQGYRILDLSQVASPVRFTVYRGDYIKLNLPQGAENPTLLIPKLGVQHPLVGDLDKSPYIKMKATGTFDFTVDALQGTITVIEYDRPQYKALTAAEAAQIIKNLNPVILDVRTQGEVARGKLPGSLHIPVQELQQRILELKDYQEENILIYCATGNRSTVAAKILVDNDFKRIYNMRRGIVDWVKTGLPVTR